MLVLTRKLGERIMIGDRVELSVVRITGGSVRLGVSAPTDVPVNRKEVHERVKDQEAARKHLHRRE